MGSVSMDCVTSIDCLPDDLLIKILSFLPTKQAASTSLLSKRWKTLFAFCHNLDIDDSIVLHPKKRKVYRRDIRRSFMDFVDSSLAFKGRSHIKTFSLKLREEGSIDIRCVDRWICNALKHGVSELHLHVESMYEPQLPSKILTSTTLVKLSLRKLHIVSFPLATSLPALKVLLLDSILIETDKLSDVFLAGCPALEDLTIHNIYYKGALSYVISSKTVKKLSVSNTCEFFVFSLNTPNVVDLYYADYAREHYIRCNMDSLAKATLDIRHFINGNYHAAAGTDLISGIHNVKTLHLTSSTVSVISLSCQCRLPVLNNLTNLVFSIKSQSWTVFLPLLLERSPNLKTLVFLGLEHYTFRGHRFVGIQIPPNNQIKILSIMQYQGSENERKHIGHFLLKMECLEVVKIYLSSAMDDPKKVQLKEDVLKLPAASSKLKIQVI